MGQRKISKLIGKRIWAITMKDTQGNEGILTFVDLINKKTIPALSTDVRVIKGMIPMADKVSQQMKTPYIIGEYQFVREMNKEEILIEIEGD